MYRVSCISCENEELSVREDKTKGRGGGDRENVMGEFENDTIMIISSQNKRDCVTSLLLVQSVHYIGYLEFANVLQNREWTYSTSQFIK